jgi:hypothetical protein
MEKGTFMKKGEVIEASGGRKEAKLATLLDYEAAIFPLRISRYQMRIVKAQDARPRAWKSTTENMTHSP